MPLIEAIIELFKRHNLEAIFKDSTFTIIPRNQDSLVNFYEVLKELQSVHRARILGHIGNATLSLEFDMQLGNLMLRFRYVTLLKKDFAT